MGRALPMNALTLRTDDGWIVTFTKKEGGAVVILATRGFLSFERILEQREVAQLRAWLAE